MTVDPHDTEFKDSVIEAVKRDGAGWQISTDGCLIFWVQDIDNPDKYAPKIGDIARFYGRGFGHPVRGLVIADHVMFYQRAR